MRLCVGLYLFAGYFFVFCFVVDVVGRYGFLSRFVLVEGFVE